MKLTYIQKLTGQIELLSGLHIGSGNTEIHIGGTDNPVIKNPITQQPYIPGSSIKGKIRSLLEWHLGVVSLQGRKDEHQGRPLNFNDIPLCPNEVKERAVNILKLFGGASDSKNDESLIYEIGPSRLAFWDCALIPAWVEEMDKKNLLLTETKMENTIDRIKGTAENPRNTERVPATAKFEFNLTLRVHDDENLTDMLLVGLKLLEYTGLGGSRGYGKIAFRELKLDGQDFQAKLNQLDMKEVA